MQTKELFLFQIRFLEAEGGRHQVRVTVEQGRRINRIRLQGENSDVTTVIQTVLQTLHSVEMAENQMKIAVLEAQQVSTFLILYYMLR